jgi:hypothetical protein
MIVTIHQPNFFPWLGYFDKMRLADVFVLLNTVPFTKGGYQNRIQIKGSNGVQWLTIPVKNKGRLGQSTREVLMAAGTPWRRNHALTLEAFYHRTPCFSEMMPQIEALYANSTEYLAEFAIPGITWVKDQLQIGARLVKSSDLNVKGSASELLLNIVRSLGGTTYLSGPSGRNYLDLGIFADAGIEVTFHSFTPFEYPQTSPPFVGGLSALDYLFNKGSKTWW